MHISIVPSLLELIDLAPANANLLPQLNLTVLFIIGSLLVGLILIKSLMEVSLLLEILLGSLSGLRANITVVKGLDSLLSPLAQQLSVGLRMVRILFDPLLS